MITARPDAPQGSVTKLEKYSISDFPPTVAILCRNNAPLISFALDLLRRGVPCQFLGRDLGVGLDKLLNKMGEPVINGIAGERQHVESKLTGRKRAEALDRLDALEAVVRGVGVTASKLQVKAQLEKLFTSKTGVALATGHKAKGLEWNTVFILDKHLCPSEWATAPWEIQQERNLMHVMVTRAQEHLRFINSKQWTQ